MGILSDLARSIVQSWHTAIFAFAAFTAFELMTARERQSVPGRLLGIVFWAIWLPLAMWIHSGFTMVWQALRIRPLIVLPMEWSPYGVLAACGAAVLAAVTYDFFFYWCHRFEHRFLWRFHAVHHSIRELNTINAFHHPIEPIVQSLLILLPLSLIVCDTGTAPLAAIMLLYLQATFIHSPSRWHFGPIGRVIVDNRFHRLHHSLEERHFDRNFGAMTTVWDHIFGTAIVPEPEQWPEVGVAGIEPPRNVRDWLLFPLRRYPDAPSTAPSTTSSSAI